MPISSAELLKNMCPELANLAAERGWEYLGADYNAEVFGDAYVSLVANGFRLKISRDRGDLFADIGDKAGTVLYDLAGLLQFLGMWNPQITDSPSAERLKAIAFALRDNIDRITELFQKDNLHKSGFVAFESERSMSDLEQLREKAKGVRIQKKE